MKLKDMVPKHLVLGQEYDDFARATDKVDFSKEDLACQVVGLTSVYYWINTESVWGPLGFNWEVYNNNGYFSTSTIGFTIIPKIPDSERHKDIYRLLRNIRTDLVFLDSGWSHLGTLKNPYGNGSSCVLDFHLDSLKDSNTYLTDSGAASYMIRGNVDTSYSQNVRLILIPENKHTLNLDISHNNQDITLKDIDDEEFNLLDYVKFNIKNNTMSKSSAKVLTLNNSLTNLKKFHPTAYSYSNGNNYYVGFIYADMLKTYTSDNPIDEIIFDFHLDEFEDTNERPLHIYNSLAIAYNRNIVYKDLDFNKIGYLSSLYHNTVFDEIPNINSFIENEKLGTIFSDCVFHKKYNYGRLPASEKVFKNCILDAGIETIPLYTLNGSNSRMKAVDYTEYFDLIFNDDTIGNQDIPTIPKSNYYTDYIYLFNIDSYSEVKASSLFSATGYNWIGSKNGTMTLKNVLNTRIFINNNNNCVIIPYDCYGALSEDMFAVISDDFNLNSIRIDITKENITQSTSRFENYLLYNYLYEYKNHKIKYIIRNNYTSIKFTTDNFIKTLDTEVILYKVNIDLSNSVLDVDLVNHFIDGIVLTGTPNDSKGKVIILYTTYYQALNQSKIEALLAEGYEIHESIH